MSESLMSTPTVGISGAEPVYLPTTIMDAVYMAYKGHNIVKKTYVGDGTKPNVHITWDSIPSAFIIGKTSILTGGSFVSCGFAICAGIDASTTEVMVRVPTEANFSNIFDHWFIHNPVLYNNLTSGAGYSRKNTITSTGLTFSTLASKYDYYSGGSSSSVGGVTDVTTLQNESGKSYTYLLIY